VEEERQEEAASLFEIRHDPKPLDPAPDMEQLNSETG
jgi:hypothetical protein